MKHSHYADNAAAAADESREFHFVVDAMLTATNARFLSYWQRRVGAPLTCGASTNQRL